jgi:general secretion pathway protein L
MLHTSSFGNRAALRGSDAVIAKRQSPRENWWSQGPENVSALLEELRPRLVRHSTDPLLVLVQRQTGLDVFCKRRQLAYDKVATLADTSDHRQLQMLASRLGRVPGERTVLRIAADRVIRKTVSLPPGTLGFLLSIVRNKVESLSPWQSSDTLWGYRLLGGRSSADTIAVEIGMTARNPVSGLTAALKAAGIVVGRIEFGDSGSAEDTISVVPEVMEKPRRDVRKVLYAAAVLGALALVAGFAGGMTAWRAQQELQIVAANTEKLRAELEGRSAAGGKTTERAAAQAEADRKHRETPLIMLLGELTELIPDDTWLQAVHLSEDRIIITGKGKAAPPMISALENSPFLQDVNFAAATERQTADSQDSFSISAKVTPDAGGK